MRLTGPVPLQDEEFATLAQRAGLIACLASGAMILMLWFAVRSLRLIASILATTLLGLMIATALGLAAFHRFNVISVAFIPLFVGLGIDIGIQFSVRYRAEQRATQDVRAALVATGHEMGGSLTLAATAIGVGFLAFGPTAYYGVSQLGVIAGLGIFTALALNLTVLPALIGLTRAPGAPDRPTNVRLTIIDKYVLGHRRRVLGTGVIAAVICAALLPLVRFDFNPMHLRSTEAESVATLLDLMRDPEMCFELGFAEGPHLEPFYFRNDYLGIEQWSRTIERGHYVHLSGLHEQHKQFARQWDNNLRLQGFAEAFGRQQTQPA